MRLKHILMIILSAAVIVPLLTLPGCSRNDDEVQLSVTMGKSTTTLTVGTTEKLTYTVTPSNVSVSMKWQSTDTTVATVSSEGVVTGVKKGAATVSVTVNGQASAICTVTVNDPEPKKTSGMENIGDGGDATEHFN